MTNLLTTLLSRFWGLVRRFLRSEHPLNVPQKHQQPILPIKNTIRMILHKTLNHMMILSWEIQWTKMRKMSWKGSVIIVPCGLNSLSNGLVFGQTPPPIPIMKTSRKNFKPFMGYSSTSAPSNIFKNRHLQKIKGLFSSVLSQSVILHVQTLEPSRNICFCRKKLIWTQDKRICFQIVTWRRSSCITTGSLCGNTYTKLVMKLVIKIVIFDKILLF